MQDIVKSNEVFTPSTSAKLTFVERNSVNSQIVNALNTPGKQLVVFGHSGCGKTTLIVNKLLQIYESHITVRCTSALTYEEIVLQAFDELNPYYQDSNVVTNISTSSLKLKADYELIKAEIGASSTATEQGTMKRIIPPSLTMQTLARFLGNAGCCFVLEDFHKIEKNEKTKLSQTMKLFVDMAEEYPELKIICIGAVNTGREVVQYDPELNDRVAEIHVPLMNDKEIGQIIDIGFPLLNIKTPYFIKNRIVETVNGVPSACHSICLHICFAMDVYDTSKIELEVNADILDKGIQGYIQDSSDSIQADFEIALAQRKGKYKNAALIFKALSTCGVEGAEQHDLLLKIREEEPEYPPGNLSSYLKQLVRGSKGGVIIKRSTKYCFRSPIYKIYSQYLFNKSFADEITHDSIDLDIQIVKEKIDYLKKKFEVS